jgi:lipopolysaccharide transport system ATP-binding protein
MSDVVIRARGLGKEYRLGRAQKRYKTLRESLKESLGGIVSRRRRDGEARQDSFWALKDVELDIRRGQAVGIIGRNGAGKSTLLKILARITEPTEGLVELTGRVGSLLEVGTGFHPELTGRENIVLNGAILGMRRAEIVRKFDEIVAFSEVERFLDTPVKHYSSGMYTRLAFSVAAHLEPEILVVDEVLAVGDAAFQKKCLGKMDEVAHQGRTVLFVSHNMGAINDLCTDCVLLKAGRVSSVGPSERVTLEYLNQGMEAVSSVVLEPKGSDATFDAVGMESAEGTPSVSFDVRKPFYVWMRFSVKRPIGGLQAAIAVINHRGDRIFYHSNAYADDPCPTEQPGTYTLHARIPGMLLVPGSYTVNVALHIPNVELFDLRESVLLFNIQETGSGRYDFAGTSAGYVLADVKWQRKANSRDEEKQT